MYTIESINFSLSKKLFQFFSKHFLRYSYLSSNSDSVSEDLWAQIDIFYKHYKEDEESYRYMTNNYAGINISNHQDVFLAIFNKVTLLFIFVKYATKDQCNFNKCGLNVLMKSKQLKPSGFL